MQTICKFSKNMLLKSKKSKQRNSEGGYKISVFAAYLLRGYSYRRTILMISIRYISERHLQESKNITSRQDGTKRDRKCYGSN